ncbi:Putrescine oxidase [Microbacterium mangrovi]|uniref:Putrescine oxidase n=1 Tax=Microbacterium mangrovi TaxID=1348253 RepID=A0A0B2A784_9MICO|nr:NAD(P)/FAD-dependent oxidoreductase [Microbacterium mangrovi]KHK98950.1 Putrescine oxidase [Microbacterium mangrovi]
MRDITRDVVVVGAGVAGTTAANELRRAGLSVAVLEARDRVGGRLRTDTIEGAMLEIGGQWVSPHQDALLQVIADLGLETLSGHDDGDSVYVGRTGESSRFTGGALPVAESTRAEMVAITARLEELAASIDPAAPWDAAHAVGLDEISFQQWLRAQTDDREASDAIALSVAGSMLGKPAHTFSLLQALHAAASAGGFGNLAVAGARSARRVAGGMQQVPLLLAERLGEDVLLEQPVHELRWDADGVSAVAESVTVHARWAVLAYAPVLHERITFVPPLPRHQQQLHQHLSMGSVLKVHAVYSCPFWREDGLSGTAVSPYEVVHEAYDDTRPGEAHGTLVGFVSDVRADALLHLDANHRRERVLASLARYFGDRALSPVVYHESDWGAAEWTRGAYAASFDLGGLHRYGADLRTPVGPVHFASSDLAGEGFQHVDGAIRTGRDAAATIIERARS